MAVFCYLGVLAGSLLFFVTDSYIACSILFVVSSMCFAASNVFYNAFLIDITSEDQRDKVSSYGYGLGYLSGFLVLVLNLLFLNYADAWFGISTVWLCGSTFLFASLWWGILRDLTFRRLKTRQAEKDVPEGKNLVTVGFSE
jgi:UMF1 family MFS transporter